METNKIKQKLNKIEKMWTEFLRKTIYVDRFNCVICGKELQVEDRYGLCDECKSQLSFNNQSICNKCGRVQNNEAQYCLTCQNYDRYFLKARSVFVYEGIARQLEYGLKFGNKRYYAEYIANMMIDKYLEESYNCEVVVPVPLSKERLKERGYNQSLLIAQYIAQKLKLQLDNQCIEKIVNNKEQAKMAGKEREENVFNVYKIANKINIKGKNILLVDDVLTTGATTSEIARILNNAGARNVSVLTLCSTRYKLASESGKIVNIEG